MSDKQLKQGLVRLGLKQNIDDACQKLLQYSELLQKWNQAYNLTSIREPNKIISHHFLDSLSIHAYLQGKRIIDVGSGAGFPGLPLAIIKPELSFTLLDSSGKRIRFLTQALTELNLTNVNLIQGRAEEYNPEKLFDCIVSRAFSNMKDYVLKTKHLCATNGVILAMKGRYPEQELQELPEQFAVDKVEKLNVPGVEGERHILVLKAIKGDFKVEEV